MKAKYILWMLAGTLLTIAACKKTTTTTDDGTPDVSGKTKQQVFMMQKWKVGTWTDSNTSIGIEDYNDACTKDDNYSFTSSTQYLLDRGACTNGDPQTETFSWSMPTATSSTVNIFGSDYTIISQTNSAIVLNRTHLLQGYSTKEILIFGKF